MWKALHKHCDTRWAPVLFALLVLGGIWGVTLWQLDNDRRQSAAVAARESRDLARLFSEHAARTVLAADQAALFLRQLYLQQGARLDVSDALRTSLGAGTLYNLFSIVDASGAVVLSSQRFAPTNLSDRPHFQVHRAAGPDRLYVSVPVQGRVSGKWSLQISRRITLADGSFGGVVVVSLDPRYFTELYGTVEIGRQGSVALVGDDGVVRARRVGYSDSLGQDIRRSAVFAALRDGAGGGVYAGPIDGRWRFYAWAELPGLPLHALVGLDQQERMAGFAARERLTLTLAALASAVVLAVSALLQRLMRRLIVSREAACAANLAKSRFLSNMSHQLRTPLNGVLGYAELLQGEFAGSRQGDFASRIHASGMQLLGLVEAVLELSGLESEQTALDLRQEPLAELLQRALAGARHAAEAKGLALTLHADAGLPPHYVCDAAKLLRVLDILLRNAVEATTAGQVQLRLASAPGRLIFRVADSGPGVPAALRRRLFEQFTMADDSASRLRDGAGLGLAIAARLTQLMGGSIVLEDSGGGAVFAVSLPYLRLQHAAGAITLSEEA
ncbi:two-component sensor histidine kinase [Duganella sp. FT134W]|uniref:histidine kinase n=1 Tax=Duganella margarita TaxID=2692170 RepID=A0A7X4KL12_9BURK|nr:ATP-binding protein [Duganella margarita]MYM76208.1 two-component sensor histidine kinase [Duganella margarita]